MFGFSSYFLFYLFTHEIVVKLVIRREFKRLLEGNHMLIVINNRKIVINKKNNEENIKNNKSHVQINKREKQNRKKNLFTSSRDTHTHSGQILIVNEPLMMQKLSN